MGLFDSLLGGGADQRTVLSLLAAAGPSATPQSFGQRLLGGLMQADQMRAQDEERKAKLGLLGAQLEETKAQAAERQARAEDMARKAQEAQRIQGLLLGAVSPVNGTQANAASGITGPRPEALSAVGQPRSINFQQLIAQGVPPELAKALAESANYGRPEVARTLEEAGPGGMPQTVQLDKFGGRVGNPLQKAIEMKLEDLGGTKQAFNPFALLPGQQFNKTNTPDALLSAQTTMRGQNMTDARAREKNSIDQQAIGKVDWKQDVNGNWVGLPKEVTGQGPVTPATTTIPGKREQQSRNALDILDAAEPLLKKATGSYAGAGIDLLGRVGGMSTQGGETIAQLKALEGALMMAQPRMEGPQSNLDVKLYAQMAGQLGDPTIPYGMKKKAVETIRSLHQKYAGQTEASPASGVRRYNPATGMIE